MKTLACLFAALLLAAVSTEACDKHKDSKADAKSKQSKTKTSVVEKRSVTGSYIPREVKRNGEIANATPYPTVVYDQEAIRNSGASDVRDFLVRRGGFR